jgi:hypothetical protein
MSGRACCMSERLALQVDLSECAAFGPLSPSWNGQIATGTHGQIATDTQLGLKEASLTGGRATASL